MPVSHAISGNETNKGIYLLPLTNAMERTLNIGIQLAKSSNFTFADTHSFLCFLERNLSTLKKIIDTFTWCTWKSYNRALVPVYIQNINKHDHKFTLLTPAVVKNHGIGLLHINKLSSNKINKRFAHYGFKYKKLYEYLFSYLYEKKESVCRKLVNISMILIKNSKVQWHNL